MKAFLCLGRQCYCTLHLFPPVLCDDAVEVLGPCRPAFDPPWMIVTVLVVPGVVSPRHHMAFQGGLEGRGGVALLQLKAMFGDVLL